MINIKFPDGSIKEFAKGTSTEEIAQSISPGLRKKAVAGIVNGEQYDLTRAINEDASLEIVTPEHEAALDILRHSSAHLLAHAVKRLYPNAKFGVGPSIENGFYYDIDLEQAISVDDLPLIEKEMKRIIDLNCAIERIEVSREEAIKMFEEAGEIYKVELVEAIPEGEQVTLYKQEDFVDLCRGVHVPSTGKLKEFKLQNVAGAYWRGDSKNKMLQRIYGTAFFTKDDLKAHLHLLEEAEKRDHRKLGKELGLFFMSEYGPGFPFFLPKGMVLRNKLEEVWRKEHTKKGYVEVKTPIMLNQELWETSGHWFNYRENMYTSEIDDTAFAIKPMNCPGSILVYKNDIVSYRDFPIKMAEMGLVHRHEFSGALHGLFRVRNFTQDDAHIYTTADDIEKEVIECLEIYEKFYSEIFDFEYEIHLSTKPEKAIGSDEIWEKAEAALAAALDNRGTPYKLNPGDGAFYGPKLDFKIKDAIGRQWQLGTIQLDMNLPERFDMTYIGKDGQKHRPIMLHRAMFGSIERFIGIVTEHYAGAFPTWLAPVQVQIIPVSNEVHMDYAKKVKAELEAAGVRVEMDTREEKLGYKIREAQVAKIPYMLVLGDKESEAGGVNVRKYGSEKSDEMTLDAFVAQIKSELR